MRTGFRVLLGLTAAAALTLGGSTAASADAAASSWKWGPIHSTDGHATAKGRIVVTQSAFQIRGDLYDTRGKGCSWVQLRWLSGSTGRWGSAAYYNCTPGTGTFRKNIGYPLTVKAKVCRGTSGGPTGRCTSWRTVYRQGG
ncbi:hypothetical protein Ppa06_08970 [Planomonospora parontospora subsp. parontospora]|uniref:Secreted protein n=2 Tax=Planomonospora parontospora TaxID=58119 RepID=A0AA37BC95_9ACTN|nr:hypothetical protein [Planomonospora parontospora]GGK50611.1 hypothetical protein GCM10010126_07640 [Planomonospora parontospora]GII07099.1 hypothetical protein Ppa06_08970 [Planomonospora parontospora subsp. parontospora]